MSKVFRLLAVVLDAILGVGGEQPCKRYMSVSEAQEKYDAGLISMREYNEVFERTENL